MLKKEDQKFLINRIEDLHKQALKRQIVTETEFLDMAEGSAVLGHLKKSHYPFDMWGGYEEAERKIALMYPDKCVERVNLSEHLTFLQVTPKNNRFVKAPGHRDYLGALMNLGIERRLLGDIIMQEQGCILICVHHIVDYLETHFTKVGNNEISLEPMNDLTDVISNRKFRHIRSTVSSTRLDSLVKVCINVSRGNSTTLIKSGKVFVNGLEVDKISFEVAEASIISIRGYGKYRLTTIGKRTKKDRLVVEIDQYT